MIKIKHSRSQGLIDHVLQMATEYHEGQVRKYTGEPYIIHHIAVANEATSFSVGAKIIRLADIIHNCESIIEQDPKHTLKALLPMLKVGSPKELYNECRELLLTHS